VIVGLDYAQTSLENALNEFKREVFGRTDLVLHTADIARNKNGFERLKDPTFRAFFYEKLNAMMRDLEFSVVACAIRKNTHLAKKGLGAIDPYMLSLDILVERFCLDLGSRENSGMIIAEKRDPVLDRELEIARLNLKVKGTRYVSAKDINNRMTGLNLRSKSENIAGLQLADLVVSPIGRHLLKKVDKEDWRIIDSKFRRSRNGEISGFGLVVLPK